VVSQNAILNLLFVNLYLAVMKRDCFIAAASIILEWDTLYCPYDPTGINLKPEDCCTVEEAGELAAAIALIKQVFQQMEISTTKETLAIERELRHRILPNVREDVVDPAWFEVTKYKSESHRM
jgi:hypothetical protein